MRLLILFFTLAAVALALPQGIDLQNPGYVSTLGRSSPAVRTITFSELLTNNSTANAAEYTTSSFTISADKLVLAFVVTSDTVAPDDHVLSSLHGTWVNIGTTNYNTVATPLKRVTLWRTMSATGGSSTLTNKFANAATGCSFNVVEFGNVDTSGSQGAGAVVQVGMNAANTTANPTITLAALTGTTNAVFAGFSSPLNPFGGTPESGWTEQFDSGYASPSTSTYGTYRIETTDNTVAVTAGSTDWGGIAVEIKAKP
jgi:hypothetical protein